MKSQNSFQNGNRPTIENSNQMLNKDGTINFNYYSRKSDIKHSNYQGDSKIDKLLTNQAGDQEEAGTNKLNFYYGKNSHRDNSERLTSTRQARTTHAMSGNIVSNFIKEGNANKLLEAKSVKNSIAVDSRYKFKKVDSAVQHKGKFLFPLYF